MKKHQGDVTFSEVKTVPKGEKVSHDGSFVLARGEATGHSHRISVKNKTKMSLVRLPDGRTFITLGEPAVVTHEEHLDIVLMPGKYEVGHEREMDWFGEAVRKVVD